MSSYSDRPTVEKQLAAYLESEDLEMDISWLENEYRQNRREIPRLKELRNEAVKAHKEQLENLARCEAEGHQLEETADGENGTSDLHCDRCGYTQHIQW